MVSRSTYTVVSLHAPRLYISIPRCIINPSLSRSLFSCLLWRIGSCFFLVTLTLSLQPVALSSFSLNGISIIWGEEGERIEVCVEEKRGRISLALFQLLEELHRASKGLYLTSNKNETTDVTTLTELSRVTSRVSLSYLYQEWTGQIMWPTLTDRGPLPYLCPLYAMTLNVLTHFL